MCCALATPFEWRGRFELKNTSPLADRYTVTRVAKGGRVETRSLYAEVLETIPQRHVYDSGKLMAVKTRAQSRSAEIGRQTSHIWT